MPHDHHHHHGADTVDESRLAEMLDLDAEILHDYLAAATALVRSRASAEVNRVVDLGAGTGTGTIALAQRFDTAEVTAVDASAPYLARLREKASHLGLDGRVRTLEADLDEAWPELDTPVDVVWASNSLHHLADPVTALTRVRTALAGDGLVAVAELDALPRFLPADIGTGRPGLEDRLHAALDAQTRDELPHLGADWAPLLAQAGFVGVTTHPFSIDLAPGPDTARYARAQFVMVRDHLHDSLDADDLATLDALLDDGGPHALLSRTDVRITGTRTIWLGYAR